MEERQQENSRSFEELGTQMATVMTLLKMVSVAVTAPHMGETGVIHPDRTKTEASRGEKHDGEVFQGYKGGDRFDFRHTKVKMPVFDGGDAYRWIYRAERYFEIQVIQREEQIRTTALCIEGSALAWYRWSDKWSPFINWEELKGRLLDLFHSEHGSVLYEQILAITQEGSAREYVNMFEKMAGQLMSLPKPILEGIFMKGLKPELWTVLRIMQPVGLAQAMKLTVTIEENQITKPAKRVRV